MDEALASVQMVIDRADVYIEWYKSHAKLNMWLYRSFGIITISTTVLIATISSSISDSNPNIFSYRKSRVVAVLATISALSVATSNFYSWHENWRGFNATQIKLETLVTSAKINLSLQKERQIPGEAVRFARTLNGTITAIVEAETAIFFDRINDEIPSKNNAAGTK